MPQWPETRRVVPALFATTSARPTDSVWQNMTPAEQLRMQVQKQNSLRFVLAEQILKSETH